MRPDKVKHLLEQYGEVTRLYLVPEDAAVARRRKKLGGQRTTNYTEGWIEFADKRDAKGVARGLHLQKIGGKKRSYYSEDVWTLKYLKHFTWSHLTEKKAYERRVRDHKLRLEMVAAKKQNEEFRVLVDQAKMIKGIEGRKQAKAAAAASAAAGDGGGGSGGQGEGEGEGDARYKAGSAKAFRRSGGVGGGDVDLAKVKRRFHQHKPLTVEGTGGAGLGVEALRGALGQGGARR